MSIAVIWFIIGVVCMIVEMLIPTFVFFFFGVGAWVASLAIYLGASLPISIGLFSVVSIATLIILRRYLLKNYKNSQKDEDASRVNGMHTGKKVVVTQIITLDNIGEVSVGGSFWRATLDADTRESTTLEHCIQVGETAIVSGHDPNDAILLHVRPL